MTHPNATRIGAPASHLSGCVVALIALLVVSNSAFAQWNQWGGAKQDFKADAKNLASSWPKDGPREVWSQELGDGYSSILFDQGKLYTMYRNSDSKEAVISLDAKTGKTIWEFTYDHSPQPKHVEQFGTGPRSTPLISGDRIYTIGVAGKMHCLNKEDGKVYWSQELWKDFGGNPLPHGYSSCPISYKDTVITLVGGKDQSIVAFNKTDGKVAWKTSSFENSYSTPKIINVDGEDQLITFMAEEVVGLDPNNGKLKWQYSQKNQWKQNISMPVLADNNTLFFSSPEAGAHGLKLTKKGGKTVVEEVWSTRKIQFYHVSSVTEGDHVFGSTGSQGTFFLAAVNMKTGKIAWRKRGFSKANVLAADGKLIILDEDGNLALANATSDKFELLSKFQLFDGVSWTIPTVSGNMLFARDKKKIVALDLS